jgi:hypothetical protein
MRPATHYRSKVENLAMTRPKCPPQPRHRDISLLLTRTVRCQPKVVARARAYPARKRYRPARIPKQHPRAEARSMRITRNTECKTMFVTPKNESLIQNCRRYRRGWRSRNHANEGLGTIGSVSTGPSHGLPPSSAGCDRDEASSGRPALRPHRLPAAIGHAAREWRWQELLRSNRMPRRHRCAAPC